MGPSKEMLTMHRFRGGERLGLRAGGALPCLLHDALAPIPYAFAEVVVRRLYRPDLRGDLTDNLPVYAAGSDYGHLNLDIIGGRRWATSKATPAGAATITGWE